MTNLGDLTKSILDISCELGGDFIREIIDPDLLGQNLDGFLLQ
jgi:hypothetical protein